MALQAHHLKQTPADVLLEKSTTWKIPIESLEFARRLDDEDHLGSFRQLFCYPKNRDIPNISEELGSTDEECVYLCGYSLGLKPKQTNAYVNEIIDAWEKIGVLSQTHGSIPHVVADMPLKAPMARLVGARECDIALMNGLTVNLHLLFCTFYQPTKTRHKIIIEDHAFPSDTYAMKSQIEFHGYSVDTSLITLKPRQGEHLIREEDILAIIEDEGDEVAVILLPGVQYYTGQLFNIKKLTAAAQAKGIIVGCDLAHAAGNVPLYLDEWNVDFAAWCTYKYLNSGPGSIGAIYVNGRFTENGGNERLRTLKGWWGNKIETKFLMSGDFDAAPGADVMKISNPPVFSCAMLRSSLDIFSKTSMEEIFKKQFLLTGYLEYLILKYFGESDSSESTCHMPSVQIITPREPANRGTMLSLVFSAPLQLVEEEIQKRGVVCDIRLPHVMRIGPMPLYNSYTDVFKFVNILCDVCREIGEKSK